MSESFNVPVAVQGDDVRTVTQALAAPFDPKEVRWKPQVIQGNRALAMPYVDARVIQDRLDEVLGIEGWQDHYEVLQDGSVVCRLRCKIGGEWVTKMDVGGPSEQPDGGDRMKAAFSDSLKRAAVKFGVGRLLYRIPTQWVDYDPVKRQFTRTPTLPPFALPKAHRPAAAAVTQPATLPAKPADKPAANGDARLPANGEELLVRLLDYEKKLCAEGICSEGQLLDHIAQAGGRAGFGLDIKAWGKPGVALASKETRAFEAAARKRLQPAVAGGGSGPYAERR
jgi:hypothetical protein